MDPHYQFVIIFLPHYAAYKFHLWKYSSENASE